MFSRARSARERTEGMHCARIRIDRRVGGTPQGHPCHKALPVAIDSPGVAVEIIQCSSLVDGAGFSLISIADDGSHADVLEGAHHVVSMFGECSVMKASKNSYLAMVMNNDCALAQIVAGSGCILTSAVPQDDDNIEWTVLAPGKGYVRNMVSRLRDEGFTASVTSSTSISVDSALTDRQEEIIEYAIQNGWYDSPKRIKMDDLCQKFGCGKSTMSVLLRGAEKKLLSRYLYMKRESFAIGSKAGRK